jgi:hypothetical protein
MATETAPTGAKPVAAERDGRMQAALERLNDSLAAAQEAAKALQRDMSRGRRDVAKNMERMLTANRRDADKLAKAVRADLADFEGPDLPAGAGEDQAQDGVPHDGVPQDGRRVTVGRRLD